MCDQLMPLWKRKPLQTLSAISYFLVMVFYYSNKKLLIQILNSKYYALFRAFSELLATVSGLQEGLVGCDSHSPLRL